MDNLELIVEKVLKKMNEIQYIPIEASARHVHLSQEHIDFLFGKGSILEKARDLSQPGQYLCKERVDLIGPKGIFTNVAVLGPARGKTQIEISRTDSFTLGINAPLRLSGNLDGAEKLFIRYKEKILEVPESTIVAMRHIHMTPEDGKRYGVKDKEVVKVKVHSPRPLIFEDVVVRVTESSKLAMHIDYDEANACDFKKGVLGEILKP